MQRTRDLPGPDCRERPDRRPAAAPAHVHPGAAVQPSRSTGLRPTSSVCNADAAARPPGCPSRCRWRGRWCPRSRSAAPAAVACPARGGGAGAGQRQGDPQHRLITASFRRSLSASRSAELLPSLVAGLPGFPASNRDRDPPSHRRPFHRRTRTADRAGRRARPPQYVPGGQGVHSPPWPHLEQQPPEHRRPIGSPSGRAGRERWRGHRRRHLLRYFESARSVSYMVPGCCRWLLSASGPGRRPSGPTPRAQRLLIAACLRRARQSA